ncbi:MAG: TRAP transporter small permease subunit, partial [Desulfobacterales bacterium]
MDLLDRLNALLNRGLAFGAGVALITMMMVTVGEMVFRMFGHPMAGTVETIGWLAAVTTAFALGYTQLHQGHVAIDLFINRIAPRLRAVVNLLVSLASTALFVIIT